MHLLVTRPEPDASALAETLRQQGHEVSIAPLLETVFCHPAPLPLKGVQALVVTSRNALRALAQNPALEAARHLPLFSVGRATSALARTLGFRTVYTGDQSAKSLPRLITINARPDAGTLLHLAGKHLARNTGAELARMGFQLDQVVLYESRAVDTLPGPVIAGLRARQIRGVLLMSPRTARQFAKLITEFGLEAVLPGLTCFCLSPQIAGVFDTLGSGFSGIKRAVSGRPQLDAFMELINTSSRTAPPRPAPGSAVK